MNVNRKKLRPFRLLVDLDLVVSFLIYLGGIILAIQILFPSYEISTFTFIVIMLGLILWQFPNEESVILSMQERIEIIQDIKNFISLKGFTLMLVIVSIFIGLLIMFLVYAVFQSVIVSTVISVAISIMLILAGIQAYKVDV